MAGLSGWLRAAFRFCSAACHAVAWLAGRGGQKPYVPPEAASCAGQYVSRICQHVTVDVTSPHQVEDRPPIEDGSSTSYAWSVKHTR